MRRRVLNIRICSMCSLLPSKVFMATAQGPSSILRKREREEEEEEERNKNDTSKTVLVGQTYNIIINVFQIVCMIVFLKASY